MIQITYILFHFDKQTGLFLLHIFINYYKYYNTIIEHYYPFKEYLYL